MMEEISHREIYDRLLAVEQEVKTIGENTAAVVTAFAAAQGAFQFLEFLGKLAKPLMWVGGLMTAIAVAYHNLTGR
jgi:hypothetical protein